MDSKLEGEGDLGGGGGVGGDTSLPLSLSVEESSCSVFCISDMTDYQVLKRDRNITKRHDSIYQVNMSDTDYKAW